MPAETAHPPSATPLQPPMGDSGDLVRLHITPLDLELAKILLSASVLPVARNISYHTIETFPEKRYGFVDLPQPEAQKLKKKFHGSVLKGSKMRVEKARPEVRMELAGEPTEKIKKKSSKEISEGSKKRKREGDTVEGVVLKDRKVKRGWTEAPTTYKKKSRKDKDSKDKEEEKEKKKRKRPKSKYTEQEECLLKTKLPPNAVGNLLAEDLAENKRKKKGGLREVTIHEFEKTTKFPSFLKHSATATDGKPATEFMEGKGWVNDEGNVVEAVKQRVPEKRKKAIKPKPAVEKEEEEDDDDDSTSSSGTSSDEASSEEEPDVEEATQAVEKGERQDGNRSQISSSSEGKTLEEENSPKSADHWTPLSATKASVPKPSPSGSSKPLAIHIPSPETPLAIKVHPLEALYKKAKPEDDTKQNAAPKAEEFSFFGGGNNEQQEESGLPTATVPMTPFARKDLEWRSVRSAAPTPDTAHPTHMRGFWPGSPGKDVNVVDAAPGGEMDDDDDDDDEEEEEEEEEEDNASVRQANPATSDFQKWFWENRRDLNRSWMTRRKTAAKEKRHRENKARASKVA